MEMLMIVGKIVLLVVFIIIGEIVGGMFFNSETFGEKLITLFLDMVIAGIVAYLLFS